MTIVYLVRHAEPNYDNHDDWSRELSSKGLKDRLLVTNYLENKEIGIVLSNPYKRALNTVKHFVEKMNIQVTIVDDFRERMVDSVWIDNFEDFTKHQWEDFESIDKSLVPDD
ncbi:histidine phosphatase family protein [Anaerocolumna sp.]|uniref:histidine phosphatase family protein n=1 Tax=Anaerocolumna sp. TaxID=2041569 RepID=UPI0028B23C16|nr:histidine phosphatase family protein [Anaerocolumna sp.]